MHFIYYESLKKINSNTITCQDFLVETKDIFDSKPAFVENICIINEDFILFADEYNDNLFSESNGSKRLTIIKSAEKQNIDVNSDAKNQDPVIVNEEIKATVNEQIPKRTKGANKENIKHKKAKCYIHSVIKFVSIYVNFHICSSELKYLKKKTFLRRKLKNKEYVANCNQFKEIIISEILARQRPQAMGAGP